MQHRQATAVVAVGVCAQLVFHVMALEVTPLPHLDNPVLRHCGVPHQITPGSIVLRILNRCTEVADYAFHQRLHNVVGNIVLIRRAEIGFHNMA